MADFSVIDARNAPAKGPKVPRPLLVRRAEYESYVLALKKGEVGKIIPAEGETARGISSRLVFAGRRTGKLVQRWIIHNAGYFKVVS